MTSSSFHWIGASLRSNTFFFFFFITYCNGYPPQLEYIIDGRVEGRLDTRWFFIDVGDIQDHISGKSSKTYHIVQIPMIYALIL